MLFRSPNSHNSVKENNNKVRKRIVKKVKEVLENNHEIIQEKSTEKKHNPESKASKSGWWERKI